MSKQNGETKQKRTRSPKTPGFVVLGLSDRTLSQMENASGRLHPAARDGLASYEVEPLGCRAFPLIGAMQVDANGKKVALVNVDNMAKGDRLETRTHELGHVVFTDALGVEQESYRGLSDQILSWTKENQSDDIKKVQPMRVSAVVS